MLLVLSTILTDVTAAIYVAKLFAEWGYKDMSITGTVVSPAGDDALDVSFTYTDAQDAPQAGCMTVWAQEDGTLYGEW